jgi:hypothetical protein
MKKERWKAPISSVESASSKSRGAITAGKCPEIIPGRTSTRSNRTCCEIYESTPLSLSTASAAIVASCSDQLSRMGRGAAGSTGEREPASNHSRTLRESEFSDTIALHREDRLFNRLFIQEIINLTIGPRRRHLQPTKSSLPPEQPGNARCCKAARVFLSCDATTRSHFTVSVVRHFS